MSFKSQIKQGHSCSSQQLWESNWILSFKKEYSMLFYLLLSHMDWDSCLSESRQNLSDETL